MGSSASALESSLYKPERIDNVKWVAQHMQERKFNPQNVSESEAYIKMYHPLGGLHILNEPEFSGEETIHKLAVHADALTVACYQKVGSSLRQDSPLREWKDISNDKIANLAYIALHHPNATVQRTAHDLLQAWRKWKQLEQRRRLDEN